jgi:nitrite reductase/ring-hydroxylating ferredoxin subunit
MSEDFVAIAKAEDLAPGQMKWVAVDRVRLVLANVDGQFYAIRDVCGHKNAPLSRGRLDSCMIECPLHFADAAPCLASTMVLKKIKAASRDL